MASSDQPQKPLTRPSDEIHTFASVPPVAGDERDGRENDGTEFTSGYDTDDAGSADAGNVYDGEQLPTLGNIAPGNTNGMDHDGVMEQTYNDNSQQIGSPVSGFDNPTDGDPEAPGIIDHRDDKRPL